MTVREYIGARYVPLFMGDWDNTNTYEPLSIVLNEGNSYTSRQYVPTGVEIDNEVYWAETGNFNAQVEQYRQEVNQLLEKFDNIITFDELDLENLPSYEVLVVVNNGLVNDVDEITFPANISWKFIDGTLDGNFTIQGYIEAPLQQIFSNTSNINISDKNYIYPVEWFGVIGSDSSVQVANTNTQILNKLMQLNYRHYKFAAQHYYTNGVISIMNSDVELNGVETSRGKSSITSLKQSEPVVQIGDETITEENMLKFIKIKDLNLRFNQPTTNGTATCLVGVSAVASDFDNIYFTNGAIGVQLSNTLSFRFMNCHFSPSLENTTNGVVFFDATTIAPKEEHASPYNENASLYIKHCTCVLDEYTAGTYGYRFHSSVAGLGPADLFIDDFQLGYMEYGIYFDLLNATVPHGNQDICLSNLIFDNMKTGLRVMGNTSNSGIEIHVSDSYFSSSEVPAECRLIDVYSERTDYYRFVQLTMTNCIIQAKDAAVNTTIGIYSCAQGININGCAFRYLTKVLRGYGRACKFNFSLFSNKYVNDSCIIFDGTRNEFNCSVLPWTGTNLKICETLFDCSSAIQYSTFDVTCIDRAAFTNLYSQKAAFDDLLTTPFTANASHNVQIGV